MDRTIHFRSGYKRHARYALLILLALIISSCKQNLESLNIVFVGDILLSRNVEKEIKLKRQSPWKNIKPEFEKTDFVIGNLEGAFGVCANVTNKLTFAIDSNMVSYLKDAGFNVLTIANNHSYDLDSIGITNTVRYLDNNNITPVSYNSSPVFFHHYNTVIALISVNLVQDKANSQIEVPSIELKQKIRLAKELSNFVIVSVHWGAELLDWTSKDQLDAAEWLTLQGVDLIIGSHPHVIQKPKLVNGKPVFFSLGNHLFDQKYKSTKEGLLVKVTLKNGIAKYKGIVTNCDDKSFFPKVKSEYKFDFEDSKYDEALLQVKQNTILPKSINTERNSLIKLIGYSDENIWQSDPLRIRSVERFNQKYLFVLQDEYSPIDKTKSIRPYVYEIDKHGINAKWRGSALSWPFLDAKVLNPDSCIICALHRGDSFLNLDSTSTNYTTAAYSWNGFGFNKLSDSIFSEECSNEYQGFINNYESSIK